VGRSCFLLETDQRVLLDYGLKIFSKGGSSKANTFPIPYQGNLDGVFISHAHLDHSGFVPELYTRPFVHWFGTPPTLQISSILWNDSLKIMEEKAPYRKVHIARAESHWTQMIYGQQLSLGDTDYTQYDAGHILGSSMLKATHNGKSLFYSGDFNSKDSRMHKGATPPEGIDYLILESTYSDREHPSREETERTLISMIEETVDEGGTVLLPAFAVGRSQELLSILHARLRGIPVYLDGMSKAVTKLYLDNPQYIRDSQDFAKACDSATFVENAQMRREATREPSVIVSTAGMMEGGPALTYLMGLHPNSRIIFSGYNVEGTNGWRLLNEGKVFIDKNELDVSIPSTYLDFSAHAGRSELLDFLKEANPEKVILNHGDNTAAFAKEIREMGFDAIAPANGDSIELG
jgi:putative mRNA 3-end processing factor